MYVTILAIITVCIAFGINVYAICANICTLRDLRKAGAIALVKRGLQDLTFIQIEIDYEEEH
ncbi:putative membrane protein [Paenibacillus phage vB_PlaP_API480]|nr:putative membrane protein [Paenibacillus phage vB_PlaP_API480]